MTERATMETFSMVELTFHNTIGHIAKPFNPMLVRFHPFPAVFMSTNNDFLLLMIREKRSNMSGFDKEYR